MCPEAAGIFVVEDDPRWIRTITRGLKLGGHTIVGVATTQKETLSKVGDFGSLGVQVVTLDGQLPDDEIGTFGGEIIAEEVRARWPDIILVGLSTYELKGVDVCVNKLTQVGRLSDIVTRTKRADLKG
jgi:CheY-like chemotaxis protein